MHPAFRRTAFTRCERSKTSLSSRFRGRVNVTGNSSRICNGDPGAVWVGGDPASAMTRSLRKTASSILCETRIIVVFGLSANSMSKSWRPSLAMVSTARNGSSSKRTSGGAIKARAKAARLAWPPESVLGNALALSLSPTLFSHVFVSRVRVTLSSTLSAKAIFLSTSSNGRRQLSWNNSGTDGTDPNLFVLIREFTS
jgi:hypothetical protein